MHWLPAPIFVALILAAIVGAEGRLEEAASQLASAVTLSESQGLKGFAAAARMRLGNLLGGDEGNALELEGAAALRRLGVHRPDRMCALLAPGFDAPFSP
jgi:hypothetical protein